MARQAGWGPCRRGRQTISAGHFLRLSIGHCRGGNVVVRVETTTGTSLSSTRGCRTVSRLQNKTNHTPLACRQRQDIRPPLALLFVLLGLRSLGRWCCLERVRTADDAPNRPRAFGALLIRRRENLQKCHSASRSGGRFHLSPLRKRGFSIGLLLGVGLPESHIDRATNRGITLAHCFFEFFAIQYLDDGSAILDRSQIT
jgi:hypothetical protein